MGREEVKKFELIRSEVKVVNGKTVFRIRALIDIPVHGVKVGDIGGFLESEDNLAHGREAWVADEASVYGHQSCISGEVLVKDRAIIADSSIWGKETVISGDVMISNSRIEGAELTIKDNVVLARVDFAVKDGSISGDAQMMNVFGHTHLYYFQMGDRAILSAKDTVNVGGSNIQITQNAKIVDARFVMGDNIQIADDVVVEKGVGIKGGNIKLSHQAHISGGLILSDNVVVSECAKLHNPQKEYGKPIQRLSLNGDVELNVYNI